MTLLASFHQSIVAADDLLAMYSELRRKRGIGKRGKLDARNQDLLVLPKSAVVASLSALDAYIHNVLYDRIPIELASANPSEALLKAAVEVFSVKKEQDLRMVLPILGARTPLTTIANRLREQKLAYASYQAPDKIILAYSLIGEHNIFTRIAATWPGPSTDSEAIRRRLVNFVRRRNQIAHEGDRKSDGSPQPMTPDYAAECRQFVDGLATRLDRLVYGP